MFHNQIDADMESLLGQRWLGKPQAKKKHFCCVDDCTTWIIELEIEWRSHKFDSIQTFDAEHTQKHVSLPFVHCMPSITKDSKPEVGNMDPGRWLELSFDFNATK